MYNELPAEALTIEVSDRVIDDSVFKQKATFVGVKISRSDLNETEVSLDFRVDLFSSKGGEYGQKIAGQGIGSYMVNVRADNTCAVFYEPGNLGHERTGEIISNRGVTPLPAWLTELNALPEPVTLQGRFYALLMKYPQAMEAAIIGECLRADSPAHNKFNATLTPEQAQAMLGGGAQLALPA